MLGQLAFVRTKQQGKFKFSPNAEPAFFVGWRLDFGLRYKGVLYCVLYSHLKEDPHFTFHDAEVYIPKDMAFPWHLAAEKALQDLEDPRRVELLDIESLPIPFVDSSPEAKQKSRWVYITYKRMLKIGASPGCKGCDNDTSSHNKECIERFERAFGKSDEAGDLVEPAPVEALQGESLPTMDDALVSDRFDVSLHHPSEKSCPMKKLLNSRRTAMMSIRNLPTVRQLLDCQLLPKLLMMRVHFCLVNVPKTFSVNH